MQPSRDEEAVRKRGSLYFSDVLAGIRSRLPAIPHAAVAAACAERLLTRHLNQPPASQRPFTISWRRPMDCIWGVLGEAADTARLRCEVADALQRFYDSPLNHSDGQDGPDDAADDPAAACICAAKSLIEGCAQS